MSLPVPESVDAPQSGIRRPWVAAVLSLLGPGVGHLYAGAPRRAVAWGVASVMAAPVVLSAAMLLPAGIQLALILALIVALPVSVAWDSARVARRSGSAYHRRWYNRWYVYLTLVLVSSYAIHPVVFTWVKSHVAEAFRIPSSAMSPTLESGDFILATPFGRSPVRAQLRVYRTGGRSFVKRVVGVGGDTLAMRDGQLLLNGAPVDEPFARAADADPVAPEFGWQGGHVAIRSARSGYQASLQTWGPLVVPPRHVFVLGDNRGSSADSRYIGFIAEDSVVARPTVIYFSRDADTGRIRWDRIGRAAGG